MYRVGAWLSVSIAYTAIHALVSHSNADAAIRRASRSQSTASQYTTDLSNLRRIAGRSPQNRWRRRRRRSRPNLFAKVMFGVTRNPNTIDISVGMFDHIVKVISLSDSRHCIFWPWLFIWKVQPRQYVCALNAHMMAGAAFQPGDAADLLLGAYIPPPGTEVSLPARWPASQPASLPAELLFKL